MDKKQFIGTAIGFIISSFIVKAICEKKQKEESEAQMQACVNLAKGLVDDPFTDLKDKFNVSEEG